MFPTHQDIQGIIVPQFSNYRLSGLFLQNNSITILFVSKNQEKWRKHRFLTFF